jgi:hypothetical protein
MRLHANGKAVTVSPGAMCKLAALAWTKTCPKPAADHARSFRSRGGGVSGYAGRVKAKTSAHAKRSRSCQHGCQVRAGGGGAAAPAETQSVAAPWQRMVVKPRAQPVWPRGGDADRVGVFCTQPTVAAGSSRQQFGFREAIGPVFRHWQWQEAHSSRSRRRALRQPCAAGNSA